MTSVPNPGSLWTDGALTYRLLADDGKYDGLTLAVVESSPWRARGRYRRCALAGDVVRLRLSDFGVRLAAAA